MSCLSQTEKGVHILHAILQVTVKPWLSRGGTELGAAVGAAAVGAAVGVETQTRILSNCWLRNGAAVGLAGGEQPRELLWEAAVRAAAEAVWEKPQTKQWELANPTAAPTASPTVTSTDAPTTAPSAAPTAVAKTVPTAAPTVTPTTAPNAVPTPAPTANPTAALLFRLHQSTIAFTRLLQVPLPRLLPLLHTPPVQL